VLRQRFTDVNPHASEAHDPEDGDLQATT